MDVDITVTGKGGHSSAPPDHTTIGLLSQIVDLIEENPWDPILTTMSRKPDFLCELI
jgi:Gly-Xaa carboxypeptidase